MATNLKFLKTFWTCHDCFENPVDLLWIAFLSSFLIPPRVGGMGAVPGVSGTAQEVSGSEVEPISPERTLSVVMHRNWED